MKHVIQSVIITGANAGLGKECARQLAKEPSVKKIYLACRNEEKALAARTDLERETGREIFEILLMDMMDSASIQRAVETLKEPVDAVVLNAGGMGGREPNKLTSDGVTNIFAVNVLGHVVLVDALLSRDLLTSVVLYSGSEAARGIPRMGVPRPEFGNYTVEELASVADGSMFAPNTDPMLIYASVKLTAALWMSAMARKHPSIRFVTMSPGGTTGTNAMDDLPLAKKILFKYVGSTLMPLFGMMHGIDVGAKRYVDGLTDSRFESGHFYASKQGSPTGAVVDQSTIFVDLANTDYQDNADVAVRRFVGAQEAN